MLKTIAAAALLALCLAPAAYAACPTGQVPVVGLPGVCGTPPSGETPAAQAYLGDLHAVTQGSNGPGTGTPRSTTLLQELNALTQTPSGGAASAGDTVIISRGGVTYRLTYPNLESILAGSSPGTLVDAGTLGQPNGPAQLDGSGNISANSVLSAGSTKARTLAARAADSCNVLDYMPTNNDVGLAWRACRAVLSAVGGGVIYIPASTTAYTVLSLETIAGTHSFPAQAFNLNGLSNIRTTAYGARFTMGVALNGAAGSTSFLGASGNAKNDGWSGGEFTQNRTGLNSGTENNASCFESVTNFSLQDVTFDVDLTDGSAVCGVYIFDSTFTNVSSPGAAAGFDTAYTENLTVFRANILGSGLASTGFSNGSDPATAGVGIVTNPNGSARSLRNGQTNGLKVVYSKFSGFASGVALDGVDGALVSGNNITGNVAATGNNAGVLAFTSAETSTLGYVTRGVTVEDNIITGNGNTTGAGGNGGVLLNTNGYGLTGIVIRNNQDYDNCGAGLDGATMTGIGTVTFVGNDVATRGGSCSQTSTISSTVIAAAGPLLTQDVFDASVLTSSPASGATLTFPQQANGRYLVNGVSTIPSLTFVFPTTPANGWTVAITAIPAITTISYTSTIGISGAAGTLAAGHSLTYRYFSAYNEWVRVDAPG